MNRWQYSSAHDLGLEAKQRYCNPHRENDFTDNLIRLGWLASLRLVFKLWNRLEVHGLENVPAQPPFVMTANHSSHLDALVIASALSLRWRDQISPLAAGDYFFCSTTRAGFSATILNALPIWRQRQRGQRHELGDLRDRLREQPAIYIVFPEGSRSRDGQLHEFKPGFATLVAGYEHPGSCRAICPAALPRCHRTTALCAHRKIILQIVAPMTFETVTNHAVGWRQLCNVVREKTVTLQSCGSPVAKPPHGDLPDKILLSIRFARFLLHRRFRRMVTKTA